MDITVFKLDIDEPTFNAPFSGDKRFVGRGPSDSSGGGVKRIVGIGVLLVATVLGGAIALKRRFGDGESEPDDDLSHTTDTDDQEEDNEEDETRGGIRALVGLCFLMVLSVVMKKKRDSEAFTRSP